MNRVSGNLKEEEARRRQFQNYKQDEQKFADKEKEKREKKKQEKWKRYEHIDTGVKLPDVGQTEDVVRAMQQSIHDDKVINYIIKLERENARLRAEEEKRRNQSPLDAACSSTISDNQAKSPCATVGRVPFDSNSTANSPSLASSNVYSPRSSVKKSSTFEFENDSTNVRSTQSQNINVNSGSLTMESGSEDEQMKQEMHKRRMEAVREKMQKLYKQNLDKKD